MKIVQEELFFYMKILKYLLDVLSGEVKKAVAQGRGLS